MTLLWKVRSDATTCTVLYSKKRWLSVIEREDIFDIDLSGVIENSDNFDTAKTFTFRNNRIFILHTTHLEK